MNSTDPPPDTIELREALRRLDALERRVDAIERHGGSAAPARAASEAAVPAGATPSPVVATAEWLPLIGRTLLVLGGAFVLRAVTEAELLHAATGSALGVVYALVWLFLADREAKRGRRASATWYGLATSIVAYPLLWEATAKFRFLDPTAAAIAVAVVTAFALAVVWRHKLRWLAWVITVSAVIVVLLLTVATRLPGLFTGCLLLIGLATLWLGYTRGLRGPAWLAASAAQASILLITAIAVIAEPERQARLFDLRTVIGLQLGLIVVYVGSAIARTLARRRALRGEEIALALAATVVGLGGAVLVTVSTGTGMLLLGSVSVVLGVSGYWAAFALVDREERRTNFVFFSSLALVFVIVAGGVLLPRFWLALALASATVVTVWVGTRKGRATLSLHGAVYSVVAAIVSGLGGASLAAFGVPILGSPPRVTFAMVGALAAAVVYCAFPVAAGERTWGRAARLPKLVVLVVAALGLGGIIAIVGSQWLPRLAASAEPAPRGLAVLRTGVLAVAAVALAWLGRYRLVLQAGWLVYPALVAAGLKLLVEDLRVGNPATLVASFALYGGALILAPRLTRTGRPH